MTTPADPHEEFEIAALRRARGALDVDGVARLDAHLATCAACRGFAATDAAARTALRRRAEEARAEKSIRGTRLRLGGIVGLDRVRLAWGLGFAALWTLAVLSLGNGPYSAWGVGSFVLVALLSSPAYVVILVRHALRRRRTSGAASLGAADLMRFCRRELDAELRRLRAGSTGLLILLVGRFSMHMYGLAVATGGHSLIQGIPWQYWEAWLVFDAYLVAWILWRRYVALPRLERERKDLGK